jgi:hypothetical protein
MAKKQQVPTNILNRFYKPQFAIGDAVYFIWLGQQKYGYVKRIKEVGWGVQYTVETNNDMRYPCGIAIGEYRTEYHTGCVMHAETKKLGTEELAKRIANSPNTRHIKPILANTRRPENESQIHVGGSGANNDTLSGKITKTRKQPNSRKNANKSGSDGVSKTTKSSRKGSSTLDDAIEKQRNFLNGFVKRD